MSPCLCRIKQTQITFLNHRHQTLVAVGLGNTPLESYLCYLGRGSWIFWAVRNSSSFAEFHFDVYACCLPSLLRDDRLCLLVTYKKFQDQWGTDQNNSHHKELIKEVNLVKFLWYDLTCGWNVSSNFCYFELWAPYNVSNMSWMRLNCDTFAPISIQTRELIGLSLYIICFKIQIELDWLVALL